jgi:hypothetical protein
VHFSGKNKPTNTKPFHPCSMTLPEKQAAMRTRAGRNPQAPRKRCSRCGIDKPLSSFTLKQDRTDYPNRRHSHCGTCRARRVKLPKREWILKYWQTHPCVDCGETDPDVLEFDHRDPGEKVNEVPRCTSLRLVIAEAAKCDVRCANCHRRRHARDRRAAKCSM